MSFTKQRTVDRTFWEQHKEEIRRMYVDEKQKLADIKQFMEENRAFPHYSELSMWKKRLKEWGFQVKHNRTSVLAAQAGEIQKCSDQGRAFLYATPGHKTLNEKELRRYLNRAKKTIINGELVKRTSPAAEPAAFYHDTAIDEGSQAQAQDYRQSSQHFDLQGDQNAPDLVHIPQKSATCFSCPQRRHSPVKSRTAAYHLQFVRPMDITYPACYASHETFLLAIQRCMMSSWNAGMWGLDDEGYLDYRRAETSNWVKPCNSAGTLLWQAFALIEPRDTRRGRKMIGTAASCLRMCFAICLPLAVNHILFTFGKSFRESNPKRMKEIILCCLAQMHDVYPGLSFFITSLAAIEPDSLGHAMLQGWDVLAWCYENFDDRLADSAIWCHNRKIQDDPFLGWRYKQERLASLLEEVDSRPARSTSDEADCRKSLAWDLWKAGDLDRAIQTSSDPLQINGLLPESRNDHQKRQAPRSLQICPFARWEAGDLRGAISDQECTIGMKIRYGVASAVGVGNKIEEWQRTLKEWQAAHANNERQERLLDEFADLSLGGSRSDPESCVPDRGVSVLSDVQVLTGSSVIDTNSNDNAGKIGSERHATAQESEVPQENPNIWLEGINPASNGQMMLVDHEANNQNDDL